LRRTVDIRVPHPTNVFVRHKASKTPPELTSPSTETLVRPGVVAAHFSVTERTILHWAHVGKIPSVKIGKTVRFNLEAVLGAVK
jgi:excisionase family DNA binding protein